MLATDPRTNMQCRAEERRIRPIAAPASNELVNIAPQYLADASHPKQLHRAAYEAYLRMKAAAEAAGIPGNLLTITSGYRSPAHQERLWKSALTRYGTPQAARKWVAPPGGSPHHTGRAIDLWLGTKNSSGNVAALRATLPYKWLVCNAARFGFFPYANEPWHWEYNPEEFVSTGGRPTTPPPPRPSPTLRPSANQEFQLVQNALRQGIADANRITSTIFYARHPERRGQPIRRDEPLLAREWMNIRERIVRPALGSSMRPSQPSVAPIQTVPSPSAPVQPAIAALKEKLVKLATQEWLRWNKGHLKESNPNMRSVLEDYWRKGVGWLPSDPQWWSAHAWSAAFISWLMRKAGAGKAFKYAAAHAVYTKAAKDNRLANNDNPFKAYRVNEAKPEVGDLVCKSRAGSGANYENIRPGLKTHCDVVVEVQPGRLTTIGGNVGQSVSTTHVRTDANGYINQAGYFAVIKMRDPHVDETRTATTAT